jgi:hypothetical protein
MAKRRWLALKCEKGLKNNLVKQSTHPLNAHFTVLASTAPWQMAIMLNASTSSVPIQQSLALLQQSALILIIMLHS